MMLPYLTPESTTQSLRYGWQVAAAFYSGLMVVPAAVDVEPPVEGIDELIDEAIACPDEHGIKITEACLREYRINPKPVYLAAARACTRTSRKPASSSHDRSASNWLRARPVSCR